MASEPPIQYESTAAALLNEYEETFPNQPDIGTRVQVTDLSGNLIPTPSWLINYRHPERTEIDRLKDSAPPQA